MLVILQASPRSSNTNLKSTTWRTKTRRIATATKRTVAASIHCSLLLFSTDVHYVCLSVCLSLSFCVCVCVDVLGPLFNLQTPNLLFTYHNLIPNVIKSQPWRIRLERKNILYFIFISFWCVIFLLLSQPLDKREREREREREYWIRTTFY